MREEEKMDKREKKRKLSYGKIKKEKSLARISKKRFSAFKANRK